MPSDPGKSPGVAARLAQAGKECVPKCVKHEWPNALWRILLLAFVRFAVLHRWGIDGPECACVLLLQARVIDVATGSRRGPYPALLGPTSAFPSILSGRVQEGAP